MARGEIRVYENSQELALEAAKEFARLADQYVVSLGRFTDRCRTPSWCRSAKFSRWSAARDLKVADTVAANT